MKHKNINFLSAYSLMLVLLGGCSTAVPEPSIKTISLDGIKLVSSTAASSSFLVSKKESIYSFCQQPTPDVGFDSSEASNFSISLVGSGSDSEGTESSVSDPELIGRTPTVLMTRELFYRLCEFSKNTNLKQADAITLYNKTLDTVSKAWMIEAGQTTVTVGETLSSTETLSNSASTEISSKSEQTETDTHSETNTLNKTNGSGD